jgi:phosphonate transport system substrate-binding protein
MSSPLEPTPPAAPPPAPKPGFSMVNVLALALPLLVIIAATFGYQYWKAMRLEKESESVDFRPYLRFTLDTPAALDPAFTDADGDLVADPPPAERQIDPPVLVFATLGRDAASDAEAWKDFVAAVQRRTGKKVELRQETYNDREHLASIRHGGAHLLQLNTGAVPAAVNLGGFVPLVAAADELGRYQYEMEFIVPKDSPYHSLADLKAACVAARRSKEERPKVALGGLRSHSSFKAPLVLLWKELDLLPGRDYEFQYAGTQRATIKGVCADPPLFPIAPVANDFLGQLVARGEAPADRYRSIYKSPPYPPACIGCVHTLKKELRDALVQVFLEQKIAGSSLAKEFGQGRVKFARVDYKRDWAPVREVDAQMRELVEQK